MNFKIRIVENIGIDSNRCIGHIGSIFEVINGVFHDIQGYPWFNNVGFDSVKEINEIFEQLHSYQTKFELVEEEQDDKE